MTERIYRLVIGIILILFLYLDRQYLYFAFLGLLAFEGITNLRIPRLISRLRYGPRYPDHMDPAILDFKINFEAERAMRLVFGSLLAIALFALPPALDPVAWLLAVALALSGLVNVCPSVILFRALGFR